MKYSQKFISKKPTLQTQRAPDVGSMLFFGWIYVMRLTINIQYWNNVEITALNQRRFFQHWNNIVLPVLAQRYISMLSQCRNTMFDQCWNNILYCQRWNNVIFQCCNNISNTLLDQRFFNVVSLSATQCWINVVLWLAHNIKFWYLTWNIFVHWHILIREFN